jgi:murein DD-endopeptidase MepM/ murein hydrolase activator NlpD
MVQVRSGDTLNNLLIRHYGYANARLRQKIMRLNGLRNPNHIRAGRNYCITPREVRVREARSYRRNRNHQLARAELARLRRLGINNIAGLVRNYKQNILSLGQIPQYSNPFIMPLNGYIITSGFGERNDPINHRRQYHPGIDIAATRGTNVPAANDGVVIYTGFFRGYGNLVILMHKSEKNCYFTVYAHNSRIMVHEGQIVSRGSTISKVGATGRATGNHLHFELRDSNGRIMNPQQITQLPFSQPSSSFSKPAIANVEQKTIDKKNNSGWLFGFQGTSSGNKNVQVSVVNVLCGDSV